VDQKERPRRVEPLDEADELVGQLVREDQVSDPHELRTGRRGFSTGVSKE